jgi:HPt (histidine-containing phosphotransfer) domain-containing protein
MSDTSDDDKVFRSDSLALDLQVLGEIELLGAVTGVDLLGQLAVIFLADARLRVIELRRAIDTSDADVFVRAAHNLRGASATLGATGLARLCCALETKSSRMSPMLNVRLLEAIEAEVERVQSAFDSRIHVASTQTGVADEPTPLFN